MTDIMREWNEALTAPTCEHGHLAPVCDLCKKDAEIARLTAERDAAFTMSRCECATDEACANLAKLHAEVAGLREALERVHNDKSFGCLKVEKTQQFVIAALAAQKGTT